MVHPESVFRYQVLSHPTSTIFTGIRRFSESREIVTSTSVPIIFVPLSKTIVAG